MARKRGLSRAPRAALPASVREARSRGGTVHQEAVKNVQLLDLEAPHGYYLIDRLPLKDLPDCNIDAVRREVDWTGRYSLEFARSRLGQPERHRKANNFSEQLKLLADRCQAISHAPIHELAGAFEYPDLVNLHADWEGLEEFAGDQREALENLIRKANDLFSDIRNFEERFPLGECPHLEIRDP